jgi:hypothetical protein
MGCSAIYEEEVNYIEATESSTVYGGDDGARGFPVSAYGLFLLQPPLVYVNQPKAIVAC